MAEIRDAEPKLFVRLALFLFAVSLLALGLSTLQFVLLNDGWIRPAPAERRDRPPAPRLQVRPPLDLEELRRREAAILGTYGWEDRARGLVRVPIGRAMDLLLEDGLPVRK